MATWVEIHEQTPRDPDASEWVLCLQWCTYHYDDAESEDGYRFIWRRPETGHLQPARGQARLPSLKLVEKRIAEAREEGWGDNHG
ncbi:MAG: hypothetical protein NXI12_06455 [Alphaproteobacteria bacterium]|nr:hypothetical protein [Alphaproteobacteria bacterium]